MRRVAILALLSACSFQRRSGDYSCTTSAECDPPRVCESGWCVTSVTSIDGSPDAPLFDADPFAPDAHIYDARLYDAPPCPTAVCTGGCPEPDLCSINCTGSGACPTQVVCPAGWRCKVECGSGACAAGVDCSAATSCRMECTGTSDCGGLLLCGPGFCHIECATSTSCTGGIDCSASCACETLCAAGACTPAPLCHTRTSGQPCADSNGYCTAGGPCNACY